MSHTFSQFLNIRRIYADMLPRWMAEYQATGEMRHDPYFFNWHFTPIERMVWSDIRSLGLPFYPQIPVLNHFIDFGCPFLKIGIECDGKAWHDSETDKARDARLAAQGWMIFRIEGHECVRTVDAFPEGDEPDARDLERFYMATSEGVLSAIKRRYFDDLGERSYLRDASLFEHRSTPETFPVRRPVVDSGGPVLLRDALAGYMGVLKARMAGAYA